MEASELTSSPHHKEVWKCHVPPLLVAAPIYSAPSLATSLVFRSINHDEPVYFQANRRLKDSKVEGHTSSTVAITQSLFMHSALSSQNGHSRYRSAWNRATSNGGSASECVMVGYDCRKSINDIP